MEANVFRGHNLIISKERGKLYIKNISFTKEQ